MRSILSEFRLYLTNYVIAKIPSHWVRLAWYRRICGFTIDETASILMGAYFDAVTGLSIGAHSVINKNVRLDTRGTITIGSNVSISADVCILTADHDLQSDLFAGREKAVIIEDHVFVGTRAMILPGVTLGIGSAVGAGSIVTRTIEGRAIVAGIPARQIGTRQVTPKAPLAEYRRLFH